MISLVVATRNRVVELERLLSSLDAQAFKDFEVIVVDQNADERIVPVLQKHCALTIHHLRSAPGLSRARNVGLRAARGEIISFPDDDCWYPNQLLVRVIEWFDVHPEYGALFTGIRNPEGRLMAPKRAPGPGPCTRKSVLSCVVSCTGFLRRRVTDVVGFFNQKIGVGSASRYQSGEDLDYFLRPLTHNFRVWYEPTLTVYHAELQSIERLRRTAYQYALGVGYVLRTHGYSWCCLSGFLLRSFGGAAISLCKADLPRAHVFLIRGIGQGWGYIFGPRELESVVDSPTDNGSLV
jgi:glycosyltransferase involved in cell wall biosynthesis